MKLSIEDIQLINGMNEKSILNTNEKVTELTRLMEKRFDGLQCKDHSDKIDTISKMQSTHTEKLTTHGKFIWLPFGATITAVVGFIAYIVKDLFTKT